MALLLKPVSHPGYQAGQLTLTCPISFSRFGAIDIRNGDNDHCGFHGGIGDVRAYGYLLGFVG
jgi:hypothetical protein